MPYIEIIFSSVSVFGSSFEIYLYAHLSLAVFVCTVRCAMWLMLDSASPRNPYVAMDCKSSNCFSLDVVKRSQTISKSSLRIPVPLSRIWSEKIVYEENCRFFKKRIIIFVKIIENITWRYFSPPYFTVICMFVEFASKLQFKEF